MEKRAEKEEILILLIGNQDGFTVLEILVVLVLIAISVSFILPSFDNVLNTTLNKTTERKIINFFNQIRINAIKIKKEQLILINDNQLIYQPETGEEIIMTKKIEEIKMEGEVKDGVEEKIHFFADGTSSGGRLLFVIEGGKEFRLNIDPVTGESQLEE